MTKLKVITAGYAESFEIQVNSWLTSHRTCHIVDIKYFHDGNHYAYITYNDGT